MVMSGNNILFTNWTIALCWKFLIDCIWFQIWNLINDLPYSFYICDILIAKLNWEKPYDWKVVSFFYIIKFARHISLINTNTELCRQSVVRVYFKDIC